MVAYTELFSSFLRRNQIKLNEPMSRTQHLVSVGQRTVLLCLKR